MTTTAASLSQNAPDASSNGTITSGVVDWSTGATNSAWVLLVVEGPGTITLTHSGDGTSTYIEAWDGGVAGAQFPAMDSYGSSDLMGSGEATYTLDVDWPTPDAPMYLYARSASLADARKSTFDTSQTAAATAPVSGQTLAWSIPAAAEPSGGAPTFQGNLRVSQAVQVSFAASDSSPTASLELFPQVDVTFAAVQQQAPKTNITVAAQVGFAATFVKSPDEYIGPWTVDETQNCNANVQVAFHATLVAAVTVPPGGSIDPVTGYTYTGTGEETAFPSPPVRLLVRSSPVFPDPIPLLDPATGRPDRTRFRQDYNRSFVGAVGRLRVSVDGRDVTHFRGPQAKVTNILLQEPFGSIQATVAFDAISPMEKIGTGDLAWLRDGANLDIDLVTVTGQVINVFEGFVPSVQDKLMARGLGIELTAVGALFQADYIMHQKPLWATVQDSGRVLADVLDGVPGRRYLVFDPPNTDIPSTDIGSVDDTRLSRARSIVGSMWTADGSNQWTVSPLGGRRFQINLKDRTTRHWTVTAGVAGVDVSLKRDLTQAPNVIKGSGVDADNQFYSWLKTPNYVPGRNEVPYPNHDTSRAIGLIGNTDRNTDSGNGVSTWQAEARRLGYNVAVTGVFGARDKAAALDIQRKAGGLVDGIVAGQTWNETFSTGKNGGDLNGAYNAAISYDPAVEPYLYVASGAILGNNPAYDPSRLRVETWVHFPDGTSKDQAYGSAQAQRNRDGEDPGYSGTITLTVDAQEGSRLLMKAGQNIAVQGHRGETRLLHIASVQHNLSSSPFQTVLTVDTQARDAMTLAAVEQRSRAATDLAKRPEGTRSRSAQAASKPLLDSEMVGYVAPTSIFPGLWSKCFVPLGKSGTVVKVELTSNPPVEFSAALFGSEVNPAFLNGLDISDPLTKIMDPNTGALVNPFQHTQEHQQALDDAGWIETWGGPDEPAGYAPPGKSAGGYFTGNLSQDGSWSFDLVSPPWATLMVYSDRPTTISGRIYVAPAV